MMKFTHLLIVFFFINVAYAHQPDFSNLMIYEKDGKKIVVLKSSLTAFEGEVDFYFKKGAYKTPEEFIQLVIKHFKNNCQITINNETVDLTNLSVILGHETTLFAELKYKQTDIKSFYIKNTFFKNTPNNQCEFILLWKDFPQYQCVLNNFNNQEVKLTLTNNKWLMDTTIDHSFAATISTFYQFTVEGFKHVLPLGLDHILFILALFFLNSNLKSSIIQASMFTLAHSITLILTGIGWINPNLNIVEPLIAFSIVVMALQNIFYPKINHTRLLLIFLFGLLHGLGFASAFLNLHLPEKSTINALLAFTFGIELAQVFIILAVFFLFTKWFITKIWYQKYFTKIVSIVIGLIALIYTFQRTILMLNT